MRVVQSCASEGVALQVAISAAVPTAQDGRSRHCRSRPGSRRPRHVGLGPMRRRADCYLRKDETMAEAALFITWGQPVRGREKRAADQMRESVRYWERLHEEGQIERFD